MSPDLARARNRMVTMVAISMLAMLAAVGFAWGHFREGVAWMLPAFVVAIFAGVGAQIWFIASIARAEKGD